MCVLVAAFAAVMAIGPAAASGAQEEPEPSVPAQTEAESAPAEETTTTLSVIAPPSPSTQDVPLTESERATRRIEYVIIGLVVLAFVVLVASIVFWRRTKPSRIMAAEIARTAAARPSVLTHEGVVRPEAGPASGTAGFSTTPSDDADRVGTAPAEVPPEASPAEPFVPVAADSSSGAARVPSTSAGAGDEMWASQGWGETSPSPTRPAPEPTPARANPATPAHATPSPEPVPQVAAPESAVERTDVGESVPPAGFFGRADDPSDDESDADSDAPNPFLPRH